MKEENNFYCSQKFTDLAINLEKREQYSCCAAAPVKIDTTWLTSNPGKLFNTPLLLKERRDMLDNKPVESCEMSCWAPERNNLISRRIDHSSYSVTHTSIDNNQPNMLNIVIGSTCNMTCSYCCKQYSSAWRRDIAENGKYLDWDRFDITPIDKILLKTSQNDISKLPSIGIIKNEIKNFSNIDTVIISGGEPFLYNGLAELVQELTNVKKLIIFSGTGVNPKRFEKQLETLSAIRTFEMAVSAENLGNFYEFNRYGNTFDNFLINLELIKKYSVPYSFSSVLSNLTIFGFLDFAKYMEHTEIVCQFSADPDFLNVNVLDDASKRQILNQLELSSLPNKAKIIQSINQPYTEEQHRNFSNYIKEFAKRRNLDLGIYPLSMLQWLN